MKKIKNKKRLAAACLLAAVLIAAAILVFSPKFFSEGPIKICAILSCSGNGASLGKSLKNGLQLAIDEMNRSGGIGGRKIRLTIRDSKTDKKEALQIFHTMQKEIRPDVYFTNMSSIAIALAPLAGQYSVPLVGFAVSSDDFTRKNPYCIRFYTSAELEGGVANEILARLKIRDLGIIHLDDAYGRSLRDAVLPAYKETGGNVSAAGFSIQGSGLDLLTAKFRTRQAVYIAGFPGHQKALLESFRRSGYRGVVIGNANLSAPAFVLDPLAENVYASAPIIYNTGLLNVQKVVKQYKKITPDLFDHHAAAAYDMLQIMKDLSGNRAFSGKEFVKSVSSGFLHSGIFGVINVRPDSRDILYPLFCARIKDGKLQYLDY